jgi:AraC-like DNA-binding protein
MTSNSVRTFTEPDEYAAAVRQGTHELTITERGNFKAKLWRIDLSTLWMQRFSEALARTSHVDDWGGRAVIAFRNEPGPSLMRDGAEVGADRISWLRPGQDYYHRSTGSADYAGMSLPLEQLALIGPAILGRELKIPTEAWTIVPSPDAMARLQRLHMAATTLAEDVPQVLAHPQASRGLEQALNEAMIHCLSGGDIREDGSAYRQHAMIMRRFYRVIEERLGQPLYLPELCREVGASERTLRACCNEHLGMGPKRYLLLRRMNLMRRALREGVPGGTTVTEIATQYGFWQFGRLAVEYKALFGETPSTTLARERD